MRPKAPETIGNKILPADPFETVDMGLALLPQSTMTLIYATKIMDCASFREAYNIQIICHIALTICACIYSSLIMHRHKERHKVNMERKAPHDAVPAAFLASI